MMPSICQIALQLVRRGVTNEDSSQKEDSQESSNLSKVSTEIVGDSQIGKDTNAPTSSVEALKSFTEPNQAESGPSVTENSSSQEVLYLYSIC